MLLFCRRSPALRRPLLLFRAGSTHLWIGTPASSLRLEQQPQQQRPSLAALLGLRQRRHGLRLPVVANPGASCSFCSTSSSHGGDSDSGTTRPGGRRRRGGKKTAEVVEPEVNAVEEPGEELLARVNRVSREEFEEAADTLFASLARTFAPGELPGDVRVDVDPEEHSVTVWVGAERYRFAKISQMRYVEYVSPVSGRALYYLDHESRRFVHAGHKYDKHELQGALLRDYLRYGSGMPKFEQW